MPSPRFGLILKGMASDDALSPPPAEPARGAATARFAADLVDSLECEDFLSVVLRGLRGFVELDNLIVFSYRQGFAADLIYSSLDHDYLAAQMVPYTNGLYLLDPFYVADTLEGRRGLLRLDDIAPQAFHESEFFLTFYQAVGVLDELHFVIPIASGRSVHLFVEREQPKKKFGADDVDCLAALEPLITSAVKRHWAWRDRSVVSERTSPIQSAGGIEGVIRNMKPGQLTRREVEVIALLLKGHSSKLIAHRLGISEGTVTNHKRNVYEKLGIHSQTQLFSMFLRTLSGDASGTV